MNAELELKLLTEIEFLKQELKTLKGEEVSQKPVYQYSKVFLLSTKDTKSTNQQLFVRAFRGQEGFKN